MSAKDYQEDPLALLDLLSKDGNVAIRRTKLPWDQDITLVDFGIKNDLAADVYRKDKSNLASSSLSPARA